MATAKQSWERRWGLEAEEFREPMLVLPAQVEEVFQWVKARAGKNCPTPKEIITLMKAADREGAPKHVRHFLWAFLHFPEAIQLHKVN